MNNNTAAAPDMTAPPAGFLQRWQAFWFTPVAPLGLHWVRFLAGLLFLAWLVPLTSEREALFGLGGWADRQFYIEAARLARGNTPGEVPPVLPGAWSLVYVCGTNGTALDILWFGSLAVLALFTLGIGTRLTAVLTWVIVVSFQANPALHFDADILLAMLAFYLMLGYLFLGQRDGELTLKERLLGPRGTSVFAALSREGVETRPSCAANLALRLLQVHFAIAVVAGTLQKLQIGDWWSGVAYWYPLHPPFEMDAAKLQAAKRGAMTMLFFMSLAQYVALAWLLTFPVFAFRRRCRWLLLGGAAVAWVGTIYIYGEPIFGPLYMVACLSYLTPAEWRRLSDRLLGLVRSSRAGGASTAIERRPRVKTST